MGEFAVSRRTFAKLAGIATGTVAAGCATGGGLAALAEDAVQQQDEGLKKVRSLCRFCGKMECAIWVWVKNGRVVDITGDEHAYTSRGNLCAKGKSGLQQLYHPDRLRYPMRRTRPKGEDPRWVRISWDEANDLAARCLQNVIDKYGGPSIRTYHGTSRQTSIGVMTCGAYLGTPNAGTTAGQICKGPRETSGMLSCYPCHWTALNENPKIFFQWGTDQEISNYDNACRVTVDAQVNSETSIVVGPRLQNLGKECDHWLPLRPGTDDALGACMLNIIINEMETYDAAFLKRWSDAAFLYCPDLEPSGFDYVNEFKGGTYPLQIKTRLLKESDLVEGGSEKRFMVWDQVSNAPVWYDADTVTWQGEDGYNEVTEFTRHNKLYVPVDPGFGANIDPALKGEYEVTLKDGRTVACRPVLQEYGNRLAEWTPERTGEYCWVNPDRIREVAEIYGRELHAGPVIYNLAPEHTGNALESERELLILSTLMGNLDAPNGNRGGEPIQSYYTVGIDFAAPIGAPALSTEVQSRVAGAERFPLLPWFRTLGGASMHYDQATATDMTLLGKPYPLRAMLSATGNHFHSANAARNWEAIRRLDFFWCAELWHVPQLELADLALPATHYLENNLLRPSQGAECGLNAQVRCQEPLGEARLDTGQIVQILKNMGIPWWPMDEESAPPWFPKEWLSIGWPNEEQMNDLSVLPYTLGFATPGPEGQTLHVENWNDFVEQYQEHGQWDLKEISPWGYCYRYMLGYLRKTGVKPGFDTPTGLFELWSTVLETYHPGHELPVIQEPLESPYSTPETYEEYPIILTSGRRIPVYFHSEGRQVPFCREQAPYPMFQINPETASDLGIEDGDWCWIESKRGRVRQRASLFYGIAPGVIECDHAWWFPELPAPTHGWDLSNINVLVDPAAQDPINGAATLRAYLVKVYKATSENSPFGNPVPCAPEDGTPIIASREDERLKDWMPLSDEAVKELS
jgi:anaerobic selenocysteine-containing dehydrogenase